MPSLVTSDGRRLSWAEAGSGPPLLCHPGGPGLSGAYFGPLPELESERTLLVLDPRGTGASDRPVDQHAYDLSDYVADVEAVREHVGLERIDLLGHSFGGFVAMAWAGAHADRVGRLVLSNTAPRFTDTIRQARQAAVMPYAGEPWFPDAIAAMQADQAGQYADDDELIALRVRQIRLLFPRWDADDQAMAARFAQSGLNSDALRHFNEQVAGGMDLRDGLANVTAPTLVITGERDFFGESTAVEIAAALPDPTMVVVPGAEHFTFAQSAYRQAWARAILDFLASG